jgi:ankyrin repeat protein
LHSKTTQEKQEENLIDAVIYGQIEEIKSLAQGVDLKQCGAKVMHTFVRSYEYRSLDLSRETLKTLASLGFSLESKDARGRTALQLGMTMDMSGAFGEMLLDFNFDPLTEDHEGNTALHYAAGHGQAKACQKILESVKTARRWLTLLRGLLCSKIKRERFSRASKSNSKRCVTDFAK